MGMEIARDVLINVLIALVLLKIVRLVLEIIDQTLSQDVFVFQATMMMVPMQTVKNVSILAKIVILILFVQVNL